ncbi:unnamed protein product [Orchesella dallaii]|uniref:Uncharacterized protein n=1 Tax=Orchesella dallaii TaxID=48710 RepID=A0ABP1Q2D1_9HEXA
MDWRALTRNKCLLSIYSNSLNLIISKDARKNEGKMQVIPFVVKFHFWQGAPRSVSTYHLSGGKKADVHDDDDTDKNVKKKKKKSIKSNHHWSNGALLFSSCLVATSNKGEEGSSDDEVDCVGNGHDSLPFFAIRATATGLLMIVIVVGE